MPNILRYEDIEQELQNGRLLTNAVNGSIQPSSYDMRVGTIFKNGKLVNETHEERDRPFQIRPGELVSIFTMEEVRLPGSIAGVAFAMNKWSSEGLLVLNPGHIDPGYEGPLTVKALNLRKTPVNISRGEPIFTVMFFDIGPHTTHPYPRPQLNRQEKERSFHAREQEVAPKGLAELLSVSQDLPFMTADQVDKAIRQHWVSRWTFGLLVVAALGGLAALFDVILR